VPQARSKETDRITCMAEELKKMAVDVEELPDGLIVRGPSPVTRATSDERRIISTAEPTTVS
jgi:3-phosphoshikimate 1-carboxyvinyltransferase